MAYDLYEVHVVFSDWKQLVIYNVSTILNKNSMVEIIVEDDDRPDKVITLNFDKIISITRWQNVINKSGNNIREAD